MVSIPFYIHFWRKCVIGINDLLHHLTDNASSKPSLSFIPPTRVGKGFIKVYKKLKKKRQLPESRMHFQHGKGSRRWIDTWERHNLCWWKYPKYNPNFALYYHSRCQIQFFVNFVVSNTPHRRYPQQRWNYSNHLGIKTMWEIMTTLCDTALC